MNNNLISQTPNGRESHNIEQQEKISNPILQPVKLQEKKNKRY